MIEGIKELGEIKLKMEGRDLSDLLSILVQDPNQDGRFPKTLCIVFKKTKKGYKYNSIRIEETSKLKINKYLYHRGASMGADITPTAKITDIGKTFKNKIKGWFKKVKVNNFIIASLKKAMEDSEKDILTDLTKKWTDIKLSLQQNQSGIVTLAIEENYKLKYIGDFPIFKDLLCNYVKAKYEKIKKINHVCAVCGKKKNEVYGSALTDIFKFYTLDKPGYIAGGFQEKAAWKNAPICLDCSLKINEGKKFLKDFLKGKMGYQQYYLIPKFILGVEGIKEVVETFFKYSTHPEEVLSNKSLSRITEDEKEILEILGELKDVLTYNFLFFSAPNPQVFKINLLVEDVLPSRIKRIFEAKKKAEKPEIFKNIELKNKYENIEFRFDEFRQFAPSQKAFLEVVDKTFRGVKIEPNLLFSWFMTPIRRGFVNESYLKLQVLKAFVSLLFFKKLKILPQKIYFKEGGELMTELKEKAESFFMNFPETFSSPAHKTVFLLGVLAQKLLNIQRQEGKATPFRKNFKGLKMKEEDFKGLLPKIQNKLEEYGKNYYHSLESLISEYFLQAGKSWGISTDELNFYFVLGMNLVDEVDKVLGLTKGKEE